MNTTPEKSFMHSTSLSWFDKVNQDAKASHLAHFDILIDATGLPTLLPDEIPGQHGARLFDGTPEHALAMLGPHLRRIQRDNEQQVRAARELIGSLDHNHLLVLLSPWPFEPLVAHLRHYTQAHWGQERHSGVFRFYDSRLFPVCCEALTPAQAESFHAPVITWHWRDDAGQPLVFSGRPRRPEESPYPAPELNLGDVQLLDLAAWSEIVQFCGNQGLTPQDQGLASQALLHRHMLHGVWAARREKVPEQEREAFLLRWVEQHRPKAWVV